MVLIRGLPPDSVLQVELSAAVQKAESERREQKLEDRANKFRPKEG